MIVYSHNGIMHVYINICKMIEFHISDINGRSMTMMMNIARAIADSPTYKLMGYELC